jgi:hypothetical protein
LKQRCRRPEVRWAIAAGALAWIPAAVVVGPIFAVFFGVVAGALMGQGVVALRASRVEKARREREKADIVEERSEVTRQKARELGFGRASPSGPHRAVPTPKIGSRQRKLR